MREWYNKALGSLTEKLRSENKVNGLEFLEDFVLEHRDEYFEDLEFNDVDHFVSEEFDMFQKWLEQEQTHKVSVRQNGKWHSLGTEKKDSLKLKTEFGLTPDETSLLELEALAFHADKVDEFKRLYQKLASTNFHELKYKCAFRLSKCAELNREISENELIQFWINASDAARDASMLKESCDCKSKAAYHYVRISEHESAAILYEEAFDIVKNIDHEYKMQLLKNARIQYQLFGNHEAASRVFTKEKKIEYSEATTSKKVALFLYRVSSSYGESPKTVLWNCFFVLLISTLIVFYMDITVKDEEAALHWLSYLARSAYYSVITFTTLGYGDFYPKTHWGQLVASLLALLGLVYSSLFMVAVVRKYSRP